MSQEYKSNLDQDRTDYPPRKPRKSLGKLAVDVAKVADPANTFSLFGFIQFIDIFFLVALMTALLKDFLDFLAIGSLPLIGTAVTFIASITISAAILICGSGSRSSYKSKTKGVVEKIAKKWGTLAAGTIFEMLFGLNFMPVETITAFVIYIFILQERREAAKT